MYMERFVEPRIGVVGAGPAGLVLARILQLHGVSCTVFERDSSAIARAQGGVLDMHSDGGQFAFRACGLYDEFLQIARYDEQETTLYDKYGVLRLFQPGHPEADRPEVDRPDIRRILLGSVAPESIRWEHVLTAVDQARPHEPVTLHFRNAPSQTFDLVIGADGAWSRVRPMVSEATPAYTGVTFYELEYAEAAAHDAGLLALTRRGNMFAMGDRQAINSHRTSSGGVHVYAGMWTGDAPGPAMTRDELIELFRAWSPELLRFLTLAESHTSTRVIAELPIGHRWQHRAGITLVGDAAHLMSPFSGEGANLAMRDATDLSLAVVHAGRNGIALDDAVAAFENMICERAQESAVGAAEGVRGAFSEDAIATIATEMQQHG
jgi:2-polyprenyl-6-methoxyphenol hydroxylase-like FAD-dependent oxidoreductase